MEIREFSGSRGNGCGHWPIDDEGVPATELAGAVTEFVTAHSPEFLIRHCRHDVGLIPRFRAADMRFEVASANLASELVIAHGMSSRRAERVWDAIALHGIGDIAEAKSPETRAACAGISADMTGAGLERFDPPVVAEIMSTRAGFARPFIDAVIADLMDKLEVANSAWMAPIAAVHVPGFQPVSVEELAYTNPYEGGGRE